MNPIVKKYLRDDTVFNVLNKKFISLEPDDIRKTNKHINKAFSELITMMKNQNSLFNSTYKGTVWTGSFYKKTKVGSPDEFDLNLIIQLPIKKENIEFSTNKPGYIKIKTNIYRNNNTLNLDAKAYKEMMSLIDDQSYLNQEYFRRWMEKVLVTTTNIIRDNNEIRLTNYTVRIQKSGPAFTLLLNIPYYAYQVNIDLVPVLAFSNRSYPPPYIDYVPSRNCDRRWFLVPKSLNDKGTFGAEEHRYWRVSLYEFEKDILSDYGRAKPIIRYLKKFRDTQGWKHIASYHIETLCFHHLRIFETFNKESSTYLFFTMLKKLHEALRERKIKHYWYDELDLWDKIEYQEITNMENRLCKIIKEIEKQVIAKPDDRFIIANYVLKPNEIARLKSSLHEAELLEPPEPQLEPETGKLPSKHSKHRI